MSTTEFPTNSKVTRTDDPTFEGVVVGQADTDGFVAVEDMDLCVTLMHVEDLEFAA